MSGKMMYGSKFTLDPGPRDALINYGATGWENCDAERMVTVSYDK